MIFLHEPVDEFAPVKHLVARHVARALAGLLIEAAYLAQGGFALAQRYLLPPRQRTEAEAVGNDERAGLLDGFYKLRIVYLGADDDDTRAVRAFLVRLAGFQLLKSLAQIWQYQFFRTAVGHQTQHMVFIARHGRIFQLAHVPYLGQYAADLVVLCDGGADCGIGYVGAEFCVHRFEYLPHYLILIVLQPVLGYLKRHVDERDEEVWLVHKAQQLEMLQRAVHLRAGLAACDGVKKAVPALDAALHQRLRVAAEIVCKVVGRDVHRPCARRAHTHGKAVVKIQQHLRHMITCVADRVRPALRRAQNKLVRCVVEQMLEVYEMFQIPHCRPP